MAKIPRAQQNMAQAGETPKPISTKRKAPANASSEVRSSRRIKRLCNNEEELPSAPLERSEGRSGGHAPPPVKPTSGAPRKCQTIAKDRISQKALPQTRTSSRLPLSAIPTNVRGRRSLRNELSKEPVAGALKNNQAVAKGLVSQKSRVQTKTSSKQPHSEIQGRARDRKLGDERSKARVSNSALKENQAIPKEDVSQSALMQTTDLQTPAPDNSSISTDAKTVSFWNSLSEENQVDTNIDTKGAIFEENNFTEESDRVCVEAEIQGRVATIQQNQEKLKGTEQHLEKAKDELDVFDKVEKDINAACLDKAGLLKILCDDLLAFEGSFESYKLQIPVSLEVKCEVPCTGMFTQHDPIFAMLKNRLADLDLDIEKAPNMKLEAIGSAICKVSLVMFRENNGGKGLTWGQRYPRLYTLAMVAARDGSDAALDMLVGLPDRDATCSGGWLLNFMKDESRSLGYKFCSAFKTMAPHDANVKRQELQRALRPHENLSSDEAHEDLDSDEGYGPPRNKD